MTQLLPFGLSLQIHCKISDVVLRLNFNKEIKKEMEHEKRKYFNYSRVSSNVHLVQINNAMPSNDAFEEYLQFSDRSTRELKGAMIIDISRRKYLSGTQRTKLGHVINSNNEEIAKNWTSLAYVNTSILSRIVLKGKLWMRPLPVKTKVFTSFDEAVTWSYKIFLEAGDQDELN